VFAIFLYKMRANESSNVCHAKKHAFTLIATGCRVTLQPRVQMISGLNSIKYFLGVLYFTYAAIILPGTNVDGFLSNAVYKRTIVNSNPFLIIMWMKGPNFCSQAEPFPSTVTPTAQTCVYVTHVDETPSHSRVRVAENICIFIVGACAASTLAHMRPHRLFLPKFLCSYGFLISLSVSSLPAIERVAWIETH
jgi:hypothetical protein